MVSVHGVLQKDDNGYPVMGGVSSANSSLVKNAVIDSVTGRLYTDNGGGSGPTFYADTVSGTINSSNVTFTVSNSISSALVLFLGGIPYQPTVDFTTSGTTITMTTAPDSTLSGQPFWLLHT
jgi:hypothetical protein